MKLSEKIYLCRKRAGKSQEELAMDIGVSRQAVSKWENGEAEPDIRNLKLLAEALGVTTDFLLSEEEPQTRQYESPAQTAPNWVESLPGVLGRFARRHGWLAGIYLFFVGCSFSLMGLIAAVVSEKMMDGFLSTANQMAEDFGGGEFPGFSVISGFSGFNPVALVGKIILAVGVLIAIGGIILAVVLKKRRDG